MMNTERIKKMLPPRIADWVRAQGIRSLSGLKQALVFERLLDKVPPVYVYQMGKVGSMSVYKSLERQYPGAVLQGHNFRADNPDALVRKLYQHTFARQKPLKVISMTREPVGRAISSFFQNFTRDTGLSLEERNFDTEELKSLFLDQHDHYYALLWFDNNILKNFEIDVFGKAFDPEAGFQIYQKDNVSVLVLQSELTDPQKQEIIQQFLAFPDFLLQNENVGEAKSYSQTYQRFKQEVRLPATYLQYLCDSKYFRHFYSEEISQRLHDRWAEYATQS